MLQHPFTLIVSEPSSCGKLVVIVWTTLPITCKTFHLLSCTRISKSWECTYTDSVGWFNGLAYSTKVSELFTKGSHHRNISLVLITQNVFLQGPSSRGFSLNSKFIGVFKNRREKSQIVHLARQVYPENFSSFHKTYLEASKDPQLFILGSNTTI